MINLGDKVKDKVTGYEGIATSRVEYLNKCVQYCVEPKVGKDGRKPDGVYIDIDQLEVTQRSAVKIDTESTGGMMANTPKGMGL